MAHRLIDQRGFTLLEVVVAFAILSVMLSTALGIFSTSMAYQTRASEQTQALMIAQTKIAGILAVEEPALGVTTGEAQNRFVWRGEVQSWSFPDQQFTVDSTYEALRIEVTVGLRERNSPLVSLETIQLIRGTTP